MALVAFTDPVEADKAVLGGKGASLVRMAQLGLPVPPGFVLGTPVGRAWLADGALPAGLDEQIDAALAGLESELGRRLGDPAAPLLVSVRSGAPVSMPGMMDTILNVGLSDAIVEALAEHTGDPHFAWSSYERLLDSYAITVRELARDDVEDALFDAVPEGDDAGAKARGAVRVLKGLLADAGAPFPEDPRRQIGECLEAVFRSWRSPRADAYRAHRGIDGDLGTAAVVQSMVFGNRGEGSGSGVAFSRDPSTGAPGVYGDVLFDAQGEDVVAGTADPDDLRALAERLPGVHADLVRILGGLERSAGDLVECEFTIEEGRLWILQFRPAQRSGRAAVRFAADAVDEGLLDAAAAAARVSDEQLTGARAPRFAAEAPPDTVIARGLAASPGAGVGAAVFDAARAQRRREAGEDVILVRPTTSPADVHGFIASVAIVTGRGGRTSHAAVVARGMARPAVCGIGEVVVARDGTSATVAGVTIREGDLLAVDGDRGLVATTAPAFAAPEEDERLARVERWRAAAEAMAATATTATAIAVPS
ncbi:pyruvate, phosphate dikinase [Paraconexibacter antarcticus]|uniref:Pyruvate, phosphate dikinase n=1 Tax=Paraconexibacter antarcticus TaxID=2949664 RepID=A0ABY5DMR6_9ACTN|nr:pyruvate, phosphate dikinase [Paraconexibacter antarcticus]UTI62347.1 pyruvate, phosphate dikinase [Paraconexibacter antarcticus]